MFSGKSKRSNIAKIYCMNVSWKNIGILYRVPIINIMGEVGDHFLCLPGMNIPYTFNFNLHSCSEGTVIRLRAGWWHVRII